jgi:GTP cyclohydrolase I
MVEESASSDVYSVLKREDEKYVTERAYNNPMFVEDIVREIALKLDKDPNITWFAVESENFESIHNHNAYAYIEKDKMDRVRRS